MYLVYLWSLDIKNIWILESTSDIPWKYIELMPDHSMQFCQPLNFRDLQVDM